MPRRNLIRQSDFPYHVCSRSNNRDWFSAPMDEVWDIALRSLAYANTKFPCNLHAMVLMSNHYHMLITTPNANIDRFMQAFNKNFSEKLKVASGRINRMFGGPYRWSVIDSKTYLYNVYRYLYQNPLRAKISVLCEDYPFSTLHYQHRKKPFPVPIRDGLGASPEILDWYNERFSALQADGIRRGLIHKTCRVNKTRDSKQMPTYEIPKMLREQTLSC